MRPTLPPQMPTLHRLNHLKSHMKQLKRLYRQEVHQEELAQRYTLLQTLSTSSITMFRHCASRGRFFTAVRALLCQYLPALSSKLFEVEQFNGRSYLVAQTKEVASVRARDTVSVDANAIELTKESIVAQWDRLGVAGRAAALVGSAGGGEDEVLADDDDSLQQAGFHAARPASPMHQPDVNCTKSWRRSVAEYVVSCPNQHLVLQIPAAKLLQSGFRPEVDLFIPSSDSRNARGTRRGHHDRRDQEQVELQLLVVALRGADGGSAGVFEAVVDSSTRVSVELLDAFGLLLASAIKMRRKACRSTMGEVDVRIRRIGHTSSPELYLPVLRVPLSSKAGGPLGNWELVAFNSGAVLEDIDSTMLRAIRKPLESLLMESETRAREIAFHNAVTHWIAGLWTRLHGQLSSSSIEEWQQCLRSSLAEMTVNGGNDDGYYCDQIQRITHIRVLFQGESSDCFRKIYGGGDAMGLESPTSLVRELDMLQQVMVSRQSIQSSGATVQLTATAVDIKSAAASGDSTGGDLSDSIFGIVVGIKGIEGDDEDLLQKVEQHVLPMLSIVVQTFAELAGNRARVLQLESNLCAAVSSNEHSQRALATSKAITGIVDQWFATASVEELVELVSAVSASEISGDLAAVKLFVVAKATEGVSSGEVDSRGNCYRTWTLVNGS